MIWFKEYTIQEIVPFLKMKTAVALMGIDIVEIGDDFLKATMPVDERTHQIQGILHGGATCLLVETVGSFASIMCLDLSKQSALGSQIYVNHLRPIKSGDIVATCKPVHIGRQKHVWDVLVNSQETGKLIAKGELTCAVINEPAIISNPKI
jgi:1,4-dihydroxy-2-naphthoyl-CoA hydrolase